MGSDQPHRMRRPKGCRGGSTRGERDPRGRDDPSSHASYNDNKAAGIRLELAPDDVQAPAAEVVRFRMMVDLVLRRFAHQGLDLALAFDEGGDDLRIEVRA